ncbi:MAG TPA: hypothetical protein VE863_05650 [Pyrinomonadaceae bacterium]|jgi:uncharacterized cupredoxin-like copper-binding protein|nr:hypothetical protein [Pyrinomonadaceae bacterium]
MKSLFLLAALLCAVVLSSTAGVASKAATSAKKQKAVAQFNEPVNLMGVTLKGTYLFVHDDAAMARGEACTFVYKGEAEIASKLVVSFHCTPIQRLKVDSFVVRTELIKGINQLREFQFNGETEAHMAPLGK